MIFIYTRLYGSRPHETGKFQKKFISSTFFSQIQMYGAWLWFFLQNIHFARVSASKGTLNFWSTILKGPKSRNLTPKNDIFGALWLLATIRPIWIFLILPKNFFSQDGAIGPHFGKILEKWKLFSRKNAFAPYIVETYFSTFAKKCVYTLLGQKTKKTQELKRSRFNPFSESVSDMRINSDISENCFKNRLKIMKYTFCQ